MAVQAYEHKPYARDADQILHRGNLAAASFSRRKKTEFPRNRAADPRSGRRAGVVPVQIIAAVFARTLAA